MTGYTVEETDTRVAVVSTARLRSTAEKAARRFNARRWKHGADFYSYRCVVQRVGFMRYEVVALQNVLVPT